MRPCHYERLVGLILVADFRKRTQDAKHSSWFQPNLERSRCDGVGMVLVLIVHRGDHGALAGDLLMARGAVKPCYG
jgi:hypothetical protein